MIMRFAISFLIVIGFEIVLGEPRREDPSKLLNVTFDGAVIYQLLFGDFQRENYMAEVTKESQVEFEGQNCRVHLFSQGSQAYSHLNSGSWINGEVRFSICVTQFKEDLYKDDPLPHLEKFHILEEIFYEFNGKLVTQISIDRVGTQIDLSSVEQLWNFDFPKPSNADDEYRLTILAQPIYGELFYSRRKRVTSVALNERGEGILISEQPIDLDMLRSRRTLEWVNCSQCGDVPQLAVVEDVKEPNYHPQTYFIGSQEVGRGSFLAILNQAFAGPLVGIGKGLKKHLISNLNWPNR